MPQPRETSSLSSTSASRATLSAASSSDSGSAAGSTPQAEPAAPRSLRRDAARNRERVVLAARQLIAERGLGVGLNEIAHHAGLGVGTVYRRFPDRDALIAEAIEEPLREMERVVERAVAAERGWDGLSMLLTRGAELLAANLGLREAALAPLGGDEVAEQERAGWGEILEALRVRAIDEGDLRPDVVGEDVLLVLWMVSELALHSREVAPELYRRYLQMLLDGLRSGPGREALVVPLAPGQAEDVARRWARR